LAGAGETLTEVSGVRCLEDPDLVTRLAKERVPLTVCPLSNVKFCVFPDLARNSFTASFVDEGCKRDWIETLDTAFAAA
jgi:adenosine deaminase